ncbi:hypothetical protein [Gordonia sp. C13]|uniref:hypothetical protein n=1 Tax=Gordonia sp. C13 TaxID=2935078 RepID=UPI00200A5B9D|nr:hypothetical protein [Gordonia sp. C13]MCK8615302.1 hypothetical protein [Gordonia sp. C13]
MTTFDPSNLLAEIEAEDAAEAQALAERQRRRREALEPAAQLAAEIEATRTEFLKADRRRLAELAGLVKEAKKNGAPAAKLDLLNVAPLTTQAGTRRGRASGARRPRRTTAPEPTAAAQYTPPTAESDGLTDVRMAG